MNVEGNNKEKTFVRCFSKDKKFKNTKNFKIISINLIK